MAVQHYDQHGRVRLARMLEDAAAEAPEDEEDRIKKRIGVVVFRSGEGFVQVGAAGLVQSIRAL